MTLPRSVADVLSDHVTFELESIDRLYCNLYVPQLQRAEGIVGFIRGHLGQPIASTAVIAPMSRDFVTLCVPKTSSMVLTSRVASRPSGRDDHRSCACDSCSS